jgi:hypothetical protein
MYTDNLFVYIGICTVYSTWVWWRPPYLKGYSSEMLIRFLTFIDRPTLSRSEFEPFLVL